MRFHVVALPQSCTTRAFSLCGFSQKTMRFCWMMKSLGHTVYLYGGEKNEAICDEHVVCIGREQQKELCKGRTYVYPDWNPANQIWVDYNKKVTEEIGKRKQPGDFVCILGGNCQVGFMETLPDLKIVEYGIGYTGWACRWLVFESYAWRAFCMGVIAKGSMKFDPYVHVIHSFYDENDFELLPERDEYALFVGRLTPNKGVGLACEACEKAGIKLKVVGLGDPKLVTHGAEYLGIVPENHRNHLMARAKVLMAPTLSWEPFGNVACEAQMCGTPVISTNWGGFTESVSDGVTGYRICDAAQAADRLGKLDKLAPSEFIRQRAIGAFSMRNIRHQYQEYFEKLSTLPNTISKQN